MKFMILVKATRDSEAGVMPTESLFEEMGAYHEQLAKAGILVDASGLQRSAKGWRIKYQGKQRSFVDGPFAETKELVAGYKRFPNPSIDGGAAEIEVRQFFELEDFGDSPALERFRKLGVGE
jgi:hypothetical protein